MLDSGLRRNEEIIGFAAIFNYLTLNSQRLYKPFDCAYANALAMRLMAFCKFSIEVAKDNRM